MCDGKGSHFLWSWKLKQFSSILNSSKMNLTNVNIEAEGLGDSKWNLKICSIKYGSGNKKLAIKLQLIDYDKNLINRKLPIHYQYELLSPVGEILVASEVINEIFVRGTDSEPYELMEMEDLMNHISNCSEDSFTLRCHMAHNGLSLTFRETQVIDCEIENIYSFSSKIFTWLSEFTNCQYWSVSRRVHEFKIPLEITLKYVDDNIKIGILSNSEDGWRDTFYWTISLVDSAGSTIVSGSGYQLLVRNKIWMFPTTITKQHLEKAECFKKEEIRIKCNIIHTSSSRISYFKNKKQHTKHVESSDIDSIFYLQQDLRSLLVDKHFTDVKFRVDNDIIFAHKVILAARSPVFSAMFQHDMAESKSGFVDILDVESKSLISFLEFIYTGEIREIDEEKALTMLIMSDKYQVISLKKKISKFLMSVLSVTNACKILSIADMVNCENLKSSVVEYIVEYSKEILSSSEWSEWTKNNIALATEVLLKLSNKFENKA